MKFAGILNETGPTLNENAFHSFMVAKQIFLWQLPQLHRCNWQLPVNFEHRQMLMLDLASSTIQNALFPPPPPCCHPRQPRSPTPTTHHHHHLIIAINNGRSSLLSTHALNHHSKNIKKAPRHQPNGFQVPRRRGQRGNPMTNNDMIIVHGCFCCLD